MVKAKATINSKGAQDVLKSAGVAREVRARLERMQAAAGPGHRIRVAVGRTRVRGTITTETRAAKRAEAQNKNLTRAIDAGRR